MRVLIKLGGTLIETAESRRRLAREIAAERKPGVEIVIVHGGGGQLTRYLAERGVESRFLNGLRVTGPAELDAVIKVIAGSVNQELVAAFVAVGAAAVGLSGVDALLTEAEPVSSELGAVGRPVRSDGRLLHTLTRHDFMPVVACVAADRNGSFYNVNADQMAASCARAFGADKLLYLTDVDGVRGADGAICPVLDVAACRGLIERKVATGGMRAKLEAAIGAVSHGVPEVTIAGGLEPCLTSRLLAGQRSGTRLIY